MALRKFEESLSCSICLDTYIDPRELQSHHIFCCSCLVRLVERDQQGQLTLPCPSCRQVTPIPGSGGARSLRQAFHINNLLDIRESIREPLSLLEDGAAARAPSSDLSSLKKVGYCSVHRKKEWELYCETCGELACLRCVIKGGKHHKHDCRELEEAFEKYKEEMPSFLEPVEKQLRDVSQALANLDTCHREVTNQQGAVEASIHAAVKQLHNIIDARKMELITKLDEITLAKLKNIDAQRYELETIQVQLYSCRDFMKESLISDSPGEVLEGRTAIVKQVEELATTLQPAMLEPNTEADMIFSVAADITTACQKYGQVLSQPDLSKFHAEGEGLKVAVVGETSKIACHGIFKSRPLVCEIVSRVTGASVPSVIEKKKLDLCEISYRPTVKGRHQLHLRIADQHIRGSPFTVVVKQSVEKIGGPIHSIGKVGGSGAAFNRKGELVVVRSSTVSVITVDGKMLHSFGSYGVGKGQFHNPQGVAVDEMGAIYVADSDNHRIQKFRANGEFLADTGTRGSGRLQFKTPYDVAFNPGNGKLYVVDANHRIQVLNADLSFSSIFGEQGSDAGQFEFPYGVACDSKGKVYVADGFNHRVQVFTAEGRFLRTIGRWGGGRGELKCPTFIAVDAKGVVYICDRDNFRVSVFTSEGWFISSFGRKGEGRGEFMDMGGVAVDDSGIVCVCDRKAKRIQLF